MAQRKVVVTNSTFQLAPWADVLFAMDDAWWDRYYKQASKQFKGLLVSTHSGVCARYNIIRAMQGSSRMKTFRNSGAAAIVYAITHLKAREVLLLGYDCSFWHGKKHWHADHPKGLGNAGTIGNWPEGFKKLAHTYPNKAIINCSRRTALTMFPRDRLENRLWPNNI